MIHSITILAQVSNGAEAGFGAAGIVVVGFLFVIVVLSVLASVTSIMGAWFTRQAANSAAKAANSAQATAEALANSSSRETAGPAAASADSSEGTAETEMDDPVLTAVISAAVHTVIGDRPHRVVSVRSAGPGWAQEGRRQIFSSHRVR
ncbi:MAG: OadG family protein [Opitutales bacterium]